MAVKKHFELDGIGTVPLYMLVNSVRVDKITGECFVFLVAFADEASRRSYAEIVAAVKAGNAALLAAQQKMAAINAEPLKDPADQLDRNVRLTAAQQDALAVQATLHAAQMKARTPRLRPIMNQGEIRIEDPAAVNSDGTPNMAAIYGWLKRPGGPMAGGEDC